MITRVRNSNLVKSRTVIVLRTNLSFSICQILKQEGFIESFEEFGDVIFTKTGFFHKFIMVTLKYKGIKQKPYITFLKRISKPGFRVYVNQNNIPKVLGGVGVAIRSL
jgi:small subunit ribosomal protein S8